MQAHFGDEVARLVEGLSDSVVDTTDGTDKPPWKERKARYLAHLAQADARIQLRVRLRQAPQRPLPPGRPS